ncbi:MAG: flippase [bacterium]|nr:flippase [bacterium]
MQINRVLRNTLALFSGQLGAQLLAFVFVALLVKIVGDAEYGRLAFAFRVVVVLNVLSEFGLWTLLVRDVAREPSSAAEYLWNSLALKLLLSVVAFALGWLALVCIYEPTLHPPAYLAAPWILFYAWYFSVAALFRAFQEHHWDGTLSFAGKLLYTGAGLLVLRFTHDVRWIALVFSASAALQWSTALLVLLWRHPSLRFSLSIARIRDLFTRSRLFFAINLFTTLHLNFAHLLVARFCSTRDLAYYNAATMLVLVPIVLANAFVQSMYPVLSAAHQRQDPAFWHKVARAMRWLAALAFPVILYMTLDGGRIITTVFRKEFVAGLVPLQILLWGLGLDFFNPLSGHILYVLNRQRRVMTITATSVITNILANFLLVPRYGIVGASCAMLISLSVMFLGYALSLLPWLSFLALGRSIMPPLLIALLIAPLAWYARPWLPFYVNGPLYCTLCAVLFFALRILRKSDFKLFALAHAPSPRNLQESSPDGLPQ